LPLLSPYRLSANTSENLKPIAVNSRIISAAIMGLLLYVSPDNNRDLGL
jgi:hypothetical protein